MMKNESKRPFDAVGWLPDRYRGVDVAATRGSRTGEFTVSVRYSGKVISQTLTPKNIKTAYRAAVNKVVNGEEI